MKILYAGRPWWSHETRDSAGFRLSGLVSVQRKITTILPNSRFELIPDSGHVVYLEHPDVFFGMLREFFARASDRADPKRVPPSR